jgi:DNA-binding response OmpR family regulator
MRLLIVEDEESLRKPVKKFLENKGFAVDEAGDGEIAKEMILTNEYDCVLLDLNLPEKDGIEVATEIREEGNGVPIIMVTARSQIYNKLEGFDSGADDYITKPFDLNELVARINALIKRASYNADEILIFGDYQLLKDENVAIHRNQKDRIELSNKEVGILEYLIRNKGKIISAEELLEHVWDSEIDSFSETVKTHIKTLRKKIDPKKDLITTVRGKGYKLEK